MVGHRTERYREFGWASARLDDAAAYVPARVTALLVAAVRPRQAGAVWRAVRDGALGHPSPNAGVAEAAFAGALGLRLGGPTVYADRVDPRPTLGDGAAPTARDIARATALSRDVALALAGALTAAAILVTAQRRFFTEPGAQTRGRRE
jgi:adenosylcobinamide-phosphate synthase